MGLSKQLIAVVAMIAVSLMVALVSSAEAATAKTEKAPTNKKLTGNPATEVRVHKVGNVDLCVTNYGIMGTMGDRSIIDPETGLPAKSCEYPAGSNINYLFQAPLWVGAIVGNDTLVSTAQDGWQFVFEMYPDAYPQGVMSKRSTRLNDPAYSPLAVSEADYIAEYYDTLTDPAFVATDPFDHRPHQPLGIKVHQESYSWSSGEYDDFVLVRYRIDNIGSNYLSGVRIGYYADGDVFHEATPNGFSDDVTGSIAVPSQFSADSLVVGWTADNDGDPLGNAWAATSPRGTFSAVWLETPNEGQQSFNWWVSNGDASLDWGPRRQANDYPLGTGGEGTPEGDVNKYLFMGNGERDYDQMNAAIDYSSEGWIPPAIPQLSEDVANGYDTRFLLSTSVGDLAPGESTTLGLAVVMGDNFHRNPDDFNNLFSSTDPQAYYDSLDFSDLKQNVAAAEELYHCMFDPMPGDVNFSCGVDMADAVFLVNYIFGIGPRPRVLNQADVNGDCKSNITDAVYLVNYIFLGGPAPVQGCVE